MKTTTITTEHVDMISSKPFDKTVKDLTAELGKATTEKLMDRLSASDSLWGPTFPELVEALPGIEIIDRSSVNAFDDARVASAMYSPRQPQARSWRDAEGIQRAGNPSARQADRWLQNVEENGRQELQSPVPDRRLQTQHAFPRGSEGHCQACKARPGQFLAAQVPGDVCDVASVEGR